MIILGIETSCDETAAAIVQNGTEVISSVVASSEEIHKKYGGIVPEQAAREQIRSIISVINEAFKISKLSSKGRSASGRKTQNSKPQLKFQNYKNSIDAIAVTVGPGLIGSLLVGVETAKTLAWLWQKPIIPVNHLIAHIYANFLSSNLAMKQCSNEIIFPALCLIVSGGHTELLLMKDHGRYQWLGGTRDDAAGECFDKCSRLLQLGYPGGPAIAQAASEVKSSIKNLKLPRPMLNQNNFDFSFSGLKTAVLNLLRKNNLTGLTYDRGSIRLTKTWLAWEIQEAITDVLVNKTIKAAKKFKVKSIFVGGGVAANDCLREKLKLLITHCSSPITLFLPDKNFCTDNAAAIASAAYFNYHPVPWQQIKVNPELGIC